MALFQHQNGSVVSNKNVFNRPRSQRKPILTSVICGLMLFCLGVISLLTGHMASELERYSQRFARQSLFHLDESNKGPIDTWKSEYAKYVYGCSESSAKFPDAISEKESNGYLLIAASGGLNQQRTGISDVVVVARILNATLVVPELDHHSYWKDDSDFFNIFDVDWFISYLAKDVTIVKRVPDKFMRSMEKPPYTMRVPRESPPEYYLDQVLPILKRRHDIDAFGERRRGKCPLTPHEVGLMLRALGFQNDTYIYVTSRETYGGEETLAPLRHLFPNLYTKETLANEELKPFLPHSSSLAAIDFVVCDESDVFVINNNGNMAKILAGRRDQMDWDTFAENVRAVQRGFMGEPDEIRAGRGEFHEYPYSCMCVKPASNIGGKESGDHRFRQFKEDQGSRKRSNGEEEAVVGVKEFET
ncbi:Detected protein of confused Function [Hibiscus syriacus]|uniref:O-fucosyltransferase family protein n=1 Tax=Hibiscus syriacus TaxID=106335 RepID=A0A6A3A685_HIBSY|nr:Detected protein of confused Function [Hibiscus syriacus]